jgi:hypothetical protein
LKQALKADNLCTVQGYQMQQGWLPALLCLLCKFHQAELF